MISLIGQNNKTLGIQNIVLSGTYTYDATPKQPTLIATPSNPAGYPLISGSRTNSGIYNFTNFTITPYGGYNASYSGVLTINRFFCPLNLGQFSCFNDGSGYGIGIVSLGTTLPSNSDIVVVNVFNGFSSITITLSNSSPSATYFNYSVYIGASSNNAFIQSSTNNNYVSNNPSFNSFCF